MVHLADSPLFTCGASLVWSAEFAACSQKLTFSANSRDGDVSARSFDDLYQIGVHFSCYQHEVSISHMDTKYQWVDHGESEKGRLMAYESVKKVTANISGTCLQCSLVMRHLRLDLRSSRLTAKLLAFKGKDFLRSGSSGFLQLEDKVTLLLYKDYQLRAQEWWGYPRPEYQAYVANATSTHIPRLARQLLGFAAGFLPFQQNLSRKFYAESSTLGVLSS